MSLRLLTCSKREPTFAVTSSTAAPVSMLEDITFTERTRSAAAAASTGERRVRASQRQLRELRRAYCASGSKYTGSPRERPSRFGRNLRADGGLSSQVLARRRGAHTHRRAEEERRVARARRLQAWISASSRLIGLAPS